MPVRTLYEFERNSRGSFHGIVSTTRGTETTMTSKRNEFQVVAFRALKQSTAVRRISAMDHFVNVFRDGGANIKGFDIFDIVRYDFL